MYTFKTLKWRDPLNFEGRLIWILNANEMAFTGSIAQIESGCTVTLASPVEKILDKVVCQDFEAGKLLAQSTFEKYLTKYLEPFQAEGRYIFSDGLTYMVYKKPIGKKQFALMLLCLDCPQKDAEIDEDGNKTSPGVETSEAYIKRLLDLKVIRKILN